MKMKTVAKIANIMDQLCWIIILSTKDSGLTGIKDMGAGSNTGLMVVFMKEYGRMTKPMAKGE